MASLLRNLPIFKGLSEPDFMRLEELIREVSHPVGHAVFRQGDPADAFYLVKSGAVRIVRHEGAEARELSVLREGEFFGEVGILEDAPRMADAVVAEAAALLAIQKTEFQRFMAINPAISMKIMCTMAKRYKAKTDDAAPGDAGGQIIGVFSATGGAGNSLVASNLAVALRDLTKKEVLLLDLDLMFGDQAGIFNVNGPQALSALYGQKEISYQMVEELIVRTPQGVGLLQSPPKPEECEMVTPDLVKVVLELAKSKWSYVILDTSDAIADLNITLLEHIDKGLFVMTPEFLSIKNAHRWLKIVDMLNIPTANIEVVANKNLEADLDLHPEIEKQLKKKFFARLPYDHETARASLNNAKFLVRDYPERLLSQEIKRMACALAGIAVPAENKSLWRRLTG